ncbi:MAG: hypothetical protein WCI71_11300 [Bacteroidota bacterium]
MKKEARSHWDHLGAKRLKLKNRPACDMTAPGLFFPASEGPAKIYLQNLNSESFIVLGQQSPASSLVLKPLQSYFVLYSNVIYRFWELSKILESFFHLHFTKKDLYGERILAHIGNEVIRAHSWIDFPFTSIEAQKLLSDNFVTGLNSFEIKDKKVRETVKSLHYEHWTPISFFRDIMHQQSDLKVEEIFEALIYNYRIVRITQAEKGHLKGYEQHRTCETYEIVGIKIFERQMWDETFRKFL